LSTRWPANDDDAEAQIEQMLDADDATLDRYWRYKATGMNQAQAALTVARRHSIKLAVPDDDYAPLVALARDLDVSVAQVVRWAVRDKLLSCGVSPGDYWRER
jgi:hypothetical protein